MSNGLSVLLGVLAVAVLSMPVYAVRARGRRDPNEIADRGTFVLGGFVREWFYWFVGPIERVALALGMSPTAFNLLGVAFGVLAGVFFAMGSTSLGGWFVLLGGAADVLDGRIARARGMANETGAFLDSTLDRFAEVGALVGLAVLFRDSVAELAVVVTALGGSLLVSYARARGESLGVVCKVGVMQRAERLLLVGFGGILDPIVTAAAGWRPGALLFGALALVAVGTVGTAIYRTVWIANRLD
ncbi:MAG: CDP-alcohol phosphatidyltransferase family protein [Gemmatimonadota bacterium]|nr:CDP-alcohol phosphatidyltransferase family protein [Gemmatimonadota bacterium]